jgi:alginate O-acetyltransferase complex protein AlgI
MIFNSIEFALFFPIVFFLYWFIAGKNIKWQNILLLGASLFFYGCWDWRFVFLLSFSTFLGYFTGIRIEIAKTQSWKKFWFWLSIVLNVGFLAIFKYYNFFVDSFAGLFNSFGMHLDPSSITLNVILPVGISFYTFHVLSYVIDIYFGRIKSERRLVDFGLFVAYFPLLVAGPIERATHLLPQIQKERSFDYAKAVDGLRQILWGLFKKVVIADGCAEFHGSLFLHNPDLLRFLWIF